MWIGLRCRAGRIFPVKLSGVEDPGRVLLPVGEQREVAVEASTSLRPAHDRPRHAHPRGPTPWSFRSRRPATASSRVEIVPVSAGSTRLLRTISGYSETIAAASLDADAGCLPAELAECAAEPWTRTAGSRLAIEIRKRLETDDESLRQPDRPLQLHVPEPCRGTAPGRPQLLPFPPAGHERVRSGRAGFRCPLAPLASRPVLRRQLVGRPARAIWGWRRILRCPAERDRGRSALPGGSHACFPPGWARDLWTVAAVPSRGPVVPGARRRPAKRPGRQHRTRRSLPRPRATGAACITGPDSCAPGPGLKPTTRIRNPCCSPQRPAPAGPGAGPARRYQITDDNLELDPLLDYADRDRRLGWAPPGRRCPGGRSSAWTGKTTCGWTGSFPRTTTTWRTWSGWVGSSTWEVALGLKVDTSLGRLAVLPYGGRRRSQRHGMRAELCSPPPAAGANAALNFTGQQGDSGTAWYTLGWNAGASAAGSGRAWTAVS